MGAKAFLSKAFPFLSVAATALGGPIGAAGASMLGAALGKEVKPADLEAELVKLAATEEGRLKAAQIEQDFKLQMERLGLGHVEELERLAAADRDSARKREIQTGDIWTPRILATVVVSAWVTIQSILLFHIVSSDMRDLVSRLLGTLDAALLLVLSYYFGSSSGSTRKNELMHQKNGG